MIIVKLWGGLCNQMFQYAFGFALSKQKKDSVYFDVDFYSNQPSYVDKRKLEIENAFDLPSFFTIDRPQYVNFFQNRYISYLIRKANFFRCQLPDNVVFIKEKEHKYCETVPFYTDKKNYYDGYWQTERYFFKYSADIKQVFMPSHQRQHFITESEIYESIKNNNSVSIHVRRGDQIGKIAGYSDAEMIDYYYRAMEYMQGLIQSPVFIVFSDDIEWCKELFNTYQGVYFQDNDEWDAVDDLIGISMCKHGIMSASTFSWWGNWLGDDGNRIVVAPRGNYFNDHFIPERWCVL